MTQDTDEKWKVLLGGFVHDVASHLTPIQAYGSMLELYLEKRVLQDKGLPVPDERNIDLTPEQALNLMRILLERARQLRGCKNLMRDEVGLGVGPFKGSDPS